ncbi:MAG: hypothetical protein ACPGYV_08395 [Phycisphaeraceae bacterium]
MFNRLRYRSWLALSLLAFVGPAAADDYKSYHIGNSLTWDSQPEGLAAMSGTQGRTHEVGYHVRSASSLDMIAADDVTTIPVVEDFGLWRDALPGHNFDAIVMQPHPTATSTLLSDQTIIAEMIDAAIGGANSYADTRFFIYQAWPRLGDRFVPVWDYTNNYVVSTDDADDTITATTRDYFDHLLARVKTARPDAQVELIPVGEVFYEIDQRLKSGELVLPGFDEAGDFYRDNVHLSSTGRWVAANAVYAAMFGNNPGGVLPVPEGEFESSQLTPELAAELQSVVFEIVPEPGSMTLLAGLGLLLARRRRA